MNQRGKEICHNGDRPFLGIKAVIRKSIRITWKARNIHQRTCRLLTYEDDFRLVLRYALFHFIAVSDVELGRGRRGYRGSGKLLSIGHGFIITIVDLARSHNQTSCSKQQLTRLSGESISLHNWNKHAKSLTRYTVKWNKRLNYSNDLTKILFYEPAFRGIYRFN